MPLLPEMPEVPEMPDVPELPDGNVPAFSADSIGHGELFRD